MDLEGCNKLIAKFNSFFIKLTLNYLNTLYNKK